MPHPNIPYDNWQPGEYLPVGIHDIWGHQPGVNRWQFQFMVAEIDDEYWFSRHNPAIRFPRKQLIIEYDSVPCIRPDVQLVYKSRSRRQKDDIDFAT